MFSEQQYNHFLPSLGSSLLLGASAFIAVGFCVLDTCGLKTIPPSQGFRGAWGCRDFGGKVGLFVLVG